MNTTAHTDPSMVVAEMTDPYVENQEFPGIIYPTSVTATLAAFRRSFPDAARLVPEEDDGAAALSVHSRDYVDFVKEGAKRPEGATKFPLNVIALPELRVSEPRTFEGRHAGYFFDEVTHATPAVCAGALRSAAASRQGARRLAGMAAARPASPPLMLVPSRPPGHHALPAVGGGLCLFANAAIAARELSRGGRVAVLDIDQDHGNGTQAVFYDDPSVLTVSIHAEGWPHVAGFAEETGGPGAPHGNLNLPLPTGSGFAAYEPALETALEAIRRFDPAYLVLALGYDAQWEQGFGALRLESEDFAVLGRRIAGLRLPTLVTTEGCYGYYESTAVAATHFFDAWAEQWR
ncbi:acetylpolyamine amidohydrolase [Sphaerisporangium siamense]|uniref:Acetoin utilization deacetylase AcuC-like enzyme n=1 Tax=Sphaerisporangium siamense TaxID=795645 RepID=A0A7W7D546_9ACTN|nr:histone deacetylase family protein [Sphaerisporangium siamense]MBB4700159.1 acetoin utilization deacetylase AcuC-like enzyme [Sphaerisporangium siamense]GII84527.1 acetylpolyamine amidohydrolase [Sphaerisporangium siamense]